MLVVSVSFSTSDFLLFDPPDGFGVLGSGVHRLTLSEGFLTIGRWHGLGEEDLHVPSIVAWLLGT